MVCVGTHTFCLQAVVKSTVEQLEAAVAVLRCYICVCVCLLASMIALVDDNNIWISDKMFIRVVKHQMVG